MVNDSSSHRLAANLREQATRMRPGDRLPSSRELVARHGLSPVTVSRALAQLAAEGVVVSRPGSGTYVAARNRSQTPADLSWQTVALGDRSVDDSAVTGLLTPPPDGTIPLTGGYLHPSLRPEKALSAAAARAVRRPEAWHTPPLQGHRGLREWFATNSAGTADDVLVVSGGQAGLSTAFRAVAAPGAPILVEDPTYPGALAAARMAGLRPVPVPIDEAGVRPDHLADAFAATGARLFYCQPTLHNPTGVTLSIDRRKEILDIAASQRAFVIEDDYARHLMSSPAPESLLSLDRDGHVIHIASLTKITSPSLRVAGVTARGPAARRLRANQLVESFFVPLPLQLAALDLVTSPAWRRHLSSVTRELAGRRDLLAASLTRAGLPPEGVPAGGLHLWVRLAPGNDDAEVTRAALREGVLVSPGHLYFAADVPGPRLRLSHASCGTREEITIGVGRLRSALISPA